MFVKICGIKDFKIAQAAISLGYDAIGVILHKKSKRYVPPEDAIKIANFCKGKIKTVCVGLTLKEVVKCVNYFDFVQLYEHANLKNLIFATSTPPDNNNFQFLMYDKSKGSGKFFKHLPDWLNRFRDKLIISGGLNEENVYDVIVRYKPFGVDVSSAVESSEGKKDFLKMKKFIEQCKKAEKEVKNV